MPGDRLDMALAVGASLKARTVGAVDPTTLILPIPRPVYCPVSSVHYDHLWSISLYLIL